MLDFENMDKRLIAYVNIFVCANRLQAIMDKGMEDVTARQWLVLTMLGAFPEPPTLKQISELSGVTHQSMRQITDRLEEKEFELFSCLDETEAAVFCSALEKLCGKLNELKESTL